MKFVAALDLQAKPSGEGVEPMYSFADVNYNVRLHLVGTLGGQCEKTCGFALIPRGV